VCRRLSRGIRPAPRLVPKLSPHCDRLRGPSALQNCRHTRLCLGPARQEDEQIPGKRRRTAVYNQGRKGVCVPNEIARPVPLLWLIWLGGQDLKKEPAYGSDTLRHWAASVEYTKDVSIGREIISQISESTRKIRNTARFMLGNLGSSSSPTAPLDAPLGFVSGHCVLWGAE
jgi:hypothetical protein